MLLAAVCGWLFSGPAEQYDLGWHLKAGELIASGGILWTDPFSHTFGGQPWIDFEWLFQLVAWAVHAAAGEPGLLAMKVAAGAAAMLFVVRLSLPGGGAAAPTGAVPAVLTITACLLAFRLKTRPELFMLALLPAVLLAFDRWSASGGRRWLAAGCLGLVVWGNSHASFVLGVAGAWLFILDRSLLAGVPVVPRRRALLGGLLATGAPLLTPYLTRIASVLGSHAAGGETMTVISEWRPLAVAGLSLVKPAQSELFWMLVLLFGVTGGLALAAGTARRRLPWIGLGLLVIGLAVRHARFAAPAALVLGPAICLLLADGAPQLPVRVRGVLVAMLWAVAVFCLHGAFVARAGWSAKMVDPGDGLHPEGVARFIETVRPDRELLNLYDDGGHLIRRLHPDYPVAIDGRAPTLYPDDFLWRLHRVNVEPQTFPAFAGRHAIRTATALRDLRSPLCRFLHRDPGWSAVYLDRQRVVFVDTATPHNRELAGRFPLDALDPCRPAAAWLDRGGVDPAAAAEMARGLRALLELGPNRPAAELLAVIEAGLLGRTTTLDELYPGGLSAPPAAAVLIARGRDRSGDRSGALDAWKQAEADPSLATPARLAAGRLLLELGRAEEALTPLEQVRTRLGFSSPNELWPLFGAAALETGRTALAVDLLGRAVEAFPDRPVYRRTLGDARVRSGDPEGALRDYLAVLTAAPDDCDTRYNAALLLAGFGQVGPARQQLDLLGPGCLAGTGLAAQVAGLRQRLGAVGDPPAVP